MKSQACSETGSRFGKREPFGQPGMLLSSQRVAGQASQRRLFVPRKTFTFHGSRRKTNVSTRTDNLSLGASFSGDLSHRRRFARQSPRPPNVAGGGQPPAPATVLGPLDPSGPAANAGAPRQWLAAGVALAQPRETLAQAMVSGTLTIDDPAMVAELAAEQAAGPHQQAEAARWAAERPYSGRVAYAGSQQRRRARRGRRPKGSATRPYRKIFYSESEGKWIEHRIFEGELKATHELSGPQPFPETNAAAGRRRRAAEPGFPRKVKGRKTSKMRELLPTAFVKGGERQDQPCRKIDVTDQLRMELYKRNMPVVPTSYQEHIFKFGKPPFRGNPRTH